MSKQTLGSRFKEIRLEKKLFQHQIGKPAKLSESVVWHVEHDWSVRWETVHLLITKGMKIKKTSDEYAELHALWVLGQAKKADAAPATKGKQLMSKHATEGVTRFRNLIRNLKPEEVRDIIQAVEAMIKPSKRGARKAAKRKL